MLAKDIKVGGEYGFRQQPRARGELEHVRVLERARSKWRVQWIEPNPGLTDYVTARQIIVPWGERRGLLRDEVNGDRLGDASAESWPGAEHPVERAVQTVLDATGEDFWLASKGVLSCDPGTLDRVCRRANMPVPEHTLGYTDRGGRCHLPFQCALEIAQGFAGAEPRTVLTKVEAEEHDNELQLQDPFDRSLLISFVNEYRAAYAVIRQWAGHDAALADRDKEIDRLRRLISRAVWDLRSKDHDPVGVARRLEHGLGGR